MANNRIYLTCNNWDEDEDGPRPEPVLLAKGWHSWQAWEPRTLSRRLKQFFEAVGEADIGCITGSAKSKVIIEDENDPLSRE